MKGVAPMPRTSASSEVKTVSTDRVAIKVNGERMPEVDRRADCPEHAIESRTYVGVNESGWVFRCSGLTEKEAKKRLTDKEPLFSGVPATEETPTAFHYFVAVPPKKRAASS